MQLVPILQALALLALANGTPVVAKKLFGSRAALPIDVGVQFWDGRPLFGTAKTVRGGCLVAGIAMVGDLFSSFVKRRLQFPPSTQAIGLDQIPESLFPLLACKSMLSLAFADIVLSVGIFLIGELIASRLLYWLRVRDQPY